ncbi:hypothetical protein VBP81_003464 [Vibrio fluvialis]|nr:hypothetical protein [Vibrio fluvialis]
MIKGLYFPDLTRQSISQYYKRGSDREFYATYNCQHNYENVSQDCKQRCVYCDVHVDECGGEKFSLDHFRPMNVFGNKFDGILKIHPFNLHFSCQQCNVLKSDDWKGCTNTQGGATYLSKLGYIDRFEVKASDYFDVDENGKVVSINSSGPGEYMIGRLHLNRTNRVYLRKLREVTNKSDLVLRKLDAKYDEVMDDWDAEILTPEEAKKKLKSIKLLMSRYTQLASLSFPLIKA